MTANRPMSDSCQLRACWSMRPSVSAFCFRGMFSFHEALAVTRCESSSQARSGRASAPLPTALWFGLWSRSSCGSCSWVACKLLLSCWAWVAWAGAKFCPGLGELRGGKLQACGNSKLVVLCAAAHPVTERSNIPSSRGRGLQNKRGGAGTAGVGGGAQS